MDSPTWQRAKARFEASTIEKRCFVCGDRGYELHHRTHQRLGFEEPEDLIPLCSRHHREASHRITNDRVSFDYAHRELRRAFLENWLRCLGPDMAQRIRTAASDGRLPPATDLVAIDVVFNGWDERFLLIALAENAQQLRVEAGFPAGPGTEMFKLRWSDAEIPARVTAAIYRELGRTREAPGSTKDELLRPVSA